MLNSDSDLRVKRQLSVKRNHFIDFQSNDYLGMARCKEYLQEVCKRAEKENWLGSGGSRLISGTKDLTFAIERKVAHFHSSETSVILNSGFYANLVIASCASHLATTAIYDDQVHASTKMGLRHFKGSTFPFRHNDLQHLEKRLEKVANGAIVFTEGIFSMSGDLAPLDKITQLCKQHSAFLVLDEAHSFGVLGDSGQGLLKHDNQNPLKLIQIVTYGKAMGAQGAAVICSHQVKEIITNYSYPFIYTTAPSQLFLTAVNAGYDYLSQRHSERNGLAEITRYFNEQKASRSKIYRAFLSSCHHIQGFRNISAKVLKQLEGNRINCAAIRPPTVRKGQEQLRIVLHSFNTHKEIDLLLDTLEAAYA